MWNVPSWEEIREPLCSSAFLNWYQWDNPLTEKKNNEWSYIKPTWIRKTNKLIQKLEMFI